MAKGKYQEWLTEDGLTLLRGWARDGLDDEQIAHNMGIVPSTLYAWKNRFEQIAEALKKGKAVVDYEVQNSLYKKCIGCYAQVDKAFKVKEIYYDENGNKCESETVEVVKLDTFIPPDTTAIAIWLNNRMSDRWRRNAGKEQLDRERFEHDKENDTKKYW